MKKILLTIVFILAVYSSASGASVATKQGKIDTTKNQSQSEIIISKNILSGSDSICKRENKDGTLTSTWGADAKFINAQLQDVRDHGQSLISKKISEANKILDGKGLTNKNKCRYSRLIKDLQNQKGLIKSYKTKNGVTTIGIDFRTYIDDISKITYMNPMGGPDNVLKNTSTKVRYYKLSSKPKLQTLRIDKTNHDSGTKYISNWTIWLNEHCNKNPIYNGVIDDSKKYDNYGYARVNWSGSNEEIDRKARLGVDYFCVKNRLTKNMLYFNFNAAGELQQIDLNRWFLEIFEG